MEIHYDNATQKLASKFINSTNQHIFLTGKAGTGKTTFLKDVVNNTHKKTIVAAPTGIAAINAGGVTLHSLFQLPFGLFIPANSPIDDNITIQANNPQSLIKATQMNASKRTMIRELELLIVDEVSMLRADLLDAIDVILRYIRRKAIPFGGLQLLFIGDLAQLPPIVKNEEWDILKSYYSGMYFFEALSFKQNPPIYLELDKIYRQTDEEFISVLNHFRDNNITNNDIEILNKHYKASFEAKENEGYIHLTTHNYKADNINSKALSKLPGKPHAYEAKVQGDFNEHLYPVEYSLELKKGSQVMFIKNDYSGEQRYFNGKIGIVSDLDDELIEVSFNDGNPPVIVDEYTWENKRYFLNKETNEINEEIKGTFTHYPLKLAWGITIHKSQGLTFEKAIIDVSKAFAPGQIYVALSRLTSLKGLILSAPINYNGLDFDDSIKNYSKNKKSNQLLEEILNNESKSYILDHIKNSFNFNPIAKLYYYHIESYNKDERRSAKQKYKGWAIELQSEIQKIKEIADRFSNQINTILAGPKATDLTFIYQRVNAAKDYFEPLLKGISDKIYSHINTIKSEPKVKKYIGELREVELLFFNQTQLIKKSVLLVDAAIKNIELLKDNVDNSELIKDRISLISKSERKLKSTGKIKESKLLKKDKPNTKMMSYNYYKDGKTIHEIAKERNLTTRTVEGHLAHYIEKGEIDIHDFIDSDSVNKVIDTIEKHDISRLAPLKEIVGGDYSYSELNFIMAHYRFKRNQ